MLATIDGDARRRTALFMLFAGLLLAMCETDPNAPEISETEIWRIELEQLADGVRTLYPRRGTITMELRLNRTTQPDPTCANDPNRFTDVTTFVATVEAFPSRLQGTASGSADGSWNCHGMVGTIRLDDGTQYDLQTGPDIGLELGHVGSFDRARSSWTSGVRSGVFVMDNILNLGERIRESHVDVDVKNRSDLAWELALERPLNIYYPTYISYGVRDTADALNLTGLQWLPVAAGGVASLTIPAHTYPRVELSATSRGLESYGFWIKTVGSRVTRLPHTFLCVLDPDHPDRLELIIDEDYLLQCGDGWVGRAYLEAARRDLFLHATGAPLGDTVSIVFYGFDPQAPSIRVSDPTITATLNQPEIGPVGTAVLTVAAPANLRRDVHNVTVEAYPPGWSQQNGSYSTTIDVWVYELDLSPDSTTLTIPAGTAASTLIRIQRVGFLPDDEVLLSTDALPAALRPSFSPSAPDGDSTRFEMRVDRSTPPGQYQVTICAAMLADPRRPCTYQPMTIVVTPAPPPATITGNVRVTQLPLERVTVKLTQGTTTIDTRQTDANGNYKFTNLDAGVYTVTISGFPGYASFPATSQNVVVNAGQTATVDFIAAYGGS